MSDKHHKPNRALLPVASFNPDPRWPTGYFQVLIEAGVPKNQHPFYAHWVRQFFNRNLGRSRRSLGPQEIADYLDTVESNPDTQQWQRDQARDALILYYEQFRGISLRDMPPPSPQKPSRPPPTHPRKMDIQSSVPRPAPPKSNPSGSVNWTALKNAVVEALRVKNYALSTERTYWMWIRKYITYHHGSKPSCLGPHDIHAYLGHLAVNEQVAASTQNQALNAIVFLYRDVLKQDVGDFSSFPRARKGKRLPVVCSREEVQKLLQATSDVEGLILRLMYGTGMRVSEALRLRVQDLLFDRSEITVREGKGNKDRRVPFPKTLKEPIQAHLDWRRSLFEQDRKKGMHEVQLPRA